MLIGLTLGAKGSEKNGKNNMAIPNRRATVGALYEAVNELPDRKNSG
jgi:hypothetical protein